MNTLAFGIGPLGPWELLVILALGLLIFGRRLPEVGRSLGKGIVEFKKGLQGIEEEVRAESSRPAERKLPEQSVTRAPLTEAGEDARVPRSVSSAPVAAEPPPAADPHAAH